MKISKLKPIKVESPESLQRIENATKTQTIGGGAPRVFDDKYPIFRFETNNKHLVYIPNFTRLDENGNEELVVESAYVHPINKGRQFMSLRATQGLTGLEEEGISGDSPLYQGVQESWELYNYKYKRVAESMGIDPNNDVGDVLKPKRQELLQQRAIKDPDLRHYFPVVVFETEKDVKTGINTFKHVLDGNNVPKYQIMWMDVSDSQWVEKWAGALDSLDEGATLAGQLVTLNYNLGEKADQNSPNLRRDSGRSLRVAIRNIGEDNKQFYEYLDEQAKEWTPAKAREVIIACALFSDEQQQEIVDDVMQETRMELNALKALELEGGTQATPIQAPKTPDEQLAGFGGVVPDEGTSEQLQTPEDDNKPPAQPLQFGAGN